MRQEACKRKGGREEEGEERHLAAEGRRKRSRREKEEEEKKKRNRLCADWWMDRGVGGGAQRFQQEDGARPLTSDYTERPPRPPLFSSP